MCICTCDGYVLIVFSTCHWDMLFVVMPLLEKLLLDINEESMNTHGVYCNALSYDFTEISTYLVSLGFPENAAPSDP